MYMAGVGAGPKEGVFAKQLNGCSESLRAANLEDDIIVPDMMR